jgi:hypothetical protein
VKVAKQWKKMQGTTPLTLAPYPEGGSIGKCEGEREREGGERERER